jgi:hypothetical protein
VALTQPQLLAAVADRAELPKAEAKRVLDALELRTGLGGGERRLQHTHRERLFSKRLISGHVRPRLGRLRAPKARSGGGLLGFVKRSFRTRDLTWHR